MVKNEKLLEILLDRYVSARELVIDSGYGLEIDWQASRNFLLVQESEFLRELAWVILNSGMRESVIRRRFTRIDDAFMGFSSAICIKKHRDRCFCEAMEVFGHEKKIKAIISAACRVAMVGFSSVKAWLISDGTEYLRTFDYLGPVTSKHLAKNLGIEVAKPDRHLLRIADATGYSSVAKLCADLSVLSGDSQPVVDLVLWRFATLQRDYVSWFKCRDQDLFGLLTRRDFDSPVSLRHQSPLVRGLRDSPA